MLDFFRTSFYKGMSKICLRMRYFTDWILRKSLSCLARDWGFERSSNLVYHFMFFKEIYLILKLFIDEWREVSSFR